MEELSNNNLLGEFHTIGGITMEYAPSTRHITRVRLDKLIQKENNMKILEIYQKRKENKLFIEYDNKIKEIESFDSVQSLIKDTEEQLNVLLGREDNDKVTISVNNLHGAALHDDITQVKVEEATFNYKNEQNKVYNLIEEVSALLEMTSDYDEQIKILKKYGILNKDGKLNV